MKITDLDPNQITRYGFDDKIMAHRMLVVNPQEVKIIEIEKPVIVKQVEVIQVDKIPYWIWFIIGGQLLLEIVLAFRR
jgi:hypothetical protein